MESMEERKARYALIKDPPIELDHAITNLLVDLRYIRDELGYEVDGYLSHHTDFMIGISKIDVGVIRKVDDVE